MRAGEFVCLIGHSGCGKTTILNILAGLDTPSAGAVIVDGEELVGPSLDRAVVFQSHALLPWMTVVENIAFAVQSRWRGSSAKQIRDRVQGSGKVKTFTSLVQNVNGDALALHVKHKGRRDPKTWKGFKFGIPHDYSMHAMLLRYYLAEHSLDPDKDVELRVFPPHNGQGVRRREARRVRRQLRHPAHLTEEARP